MKDIERLAVVEQVAASAHKRLDTHDDELKIQRDARHLHANVIQRHTGMLESHSEVFVGIKDALKELAGNTRQNTSAIFRFEAMAITAIIMGGGFITFCGFVGGKLLHWW